MFVLLSLLSLVLAPFVILASTSQESSSTTRIESVNSSLESPYKMNVEILLTCGKYLSGKEFHTEMDRPVIWGKRKKTVSYYDIPAKAISIYAVDENETEEKKSQIVITITKDKRVFSTPAEVIEQPDSVYRKGTLLTLDLYNQVDPSSELPRILESDEDSKDGAAWATFYPIDPLGYGYIKVKDPHRFANLTLVERNFPGKSPTNISSNSELTEKDNPIERKLALKKFHDELVKRIQMAPTRTENVFIIRSSTVTGLSPNRFMDRLSQGYCYCQNISEAMNAAIEASKRNIYDMGIPLYRHDQTTGKDLPLPIEMRDLSNCGYF